MDTYKEMIILIAEDDEGHADLIKEGLRDSGICNKIVHFIDGEDIWNFFTGKKPYNSTSDVVFEKNKSYLLLLDINMPKMDGVEVLKRMKETENLKKIPVMMLTTTDDPREVEHCYEYGCSVYITKPVDFSKFAEILHRLGLFVQIVKI